MHDSELILNPDGSVYHLGLLPEHLAETVILVGDPARVGKVSAHFSDIEIVKQKREFVTHTGTFTGRRISVISTGISTDNIDIVLNEVDALVNVDMATRCTKEHIKPLNIIRLGTSGSIHPEIKVDSILISANAIGMDGLNRHYSTDAELRKPSGWNDFSLYFNDILDVPLYVSSADPILRAAFSEFPAGNTLTCPGFYGPQGRILRLKGRLGPFLGEIHSHSLDDIPITNMEMETAGVYLMSQLLGHRSISVNAILANRLDGTFSTDPDGTVNRMIRESLEVLARMN